MENQKKKKNKIDYKVTIVTPPAPEASDADTPKNYAQDDVSTKSCIPYSLKNFKLVPYSTNTMENQKIKKGKAMINLQSTPTLAPKHLCLIPPMLPPNMLAPLTPIPHIHWEIAICPLLHHHHEKLEK